MTATLEWFGMRWDHDCLDTWLTIIRGHDLPPTYKRPYHLPRQLAGQTGEDATVLGAQRRPRSGLHFYLPCAL